ncbi:hypothetical protein BJ742DRAFT_834198 [Cladochytrium replicatum]|nr:hypothetical protein BJ742DRAFT_834198 [Cladochytrium replicatum]
MLLHRTQVYRHLLFNRLRPSAKWGGWNVSLLVEHGVEKVFFLNFIFLWTGYGCEAERPSGSFRNVKWFRLEKAHGRSAFPSDDWPLASQYLCILFLCAMDTLVWHLGTRFAASVLLPTHEDYQTRRAQLPGPRTESEVNLLADHAPTPPFQLVTSALVISSFGKLLPILMVIWDYEELAHAWVVSLVVLSSNAKALGAIGVRGFGAAGLILATGLGFKVGWQLLARAVLNPLIIVDPF